MLTGADDELDCNEELKFHNEMKSTKEGRKDKDTIISLVFSLIENNCSLQILSLLVHVFM